MKAIIIFLLAVGPLLAKAQICTFPDSVKTIATVFIDGQELNFNAAATDSIIQIIEDPDTGEQTIHKYYYFPVLQLMAYRQWQVTSTTGGTGSVQTLTINGHYQLSQPQTGFTSNNKRELLYFARKTSSWSVGIGD